MNKPTLFVILISIISFASYEKFYLKPKAENPPDSYPVIINSNNSSHYENSKHLDGNLNGEITVGEQKKAYELSTDRKFIEMMDFVKGLNQVDRRVVYGLSFGVAKEAVLLPVETKFQLANLKLDPAQKVQKINALLKKNLEK